MVIAATRPAKPSTPRTWAYDDPKPRLFTGAEVRTMRDAGILSDGERAVSLGGVIHVKDVAGGFAPRLFTRDEYYAMAETGVIGYRERLQLIEGEIVIMAAAGNRHIAGTILPTDEFAVSGRLRPDAHP